MMRAFFALLLLIGLSAQAEKYEKVSVDVKAVHLHGGSYYVPGLSGAATEFEGFISNAGFVITSEGVVVFDALGTPSLANAMLEEIKRLTDKPIKLVISSHYHADHIYGLQVFKEQGAKIWAPKGAINYLESENAENLLDARRTALFPWVSDDTYLVRPDKIIDKDIEFSMGEHHFLISYFGSVHSDGDMSLLNKTDETLYIGDVIFAGRIPFVGDADVKKWIATLDRMMKVDMRYLVPGHGLASGDAQESMSLTYRYLKYLLEKLTPAVEEMEQFADIYDLIDWSDFANEVAFDDANRTNAYAVYLYLERTLE